MFYKKLFFLQCFWTKSASQFKHTKTFHAWIDQKKKKKVPVLKDKQGDKGSIGFLDTKTGTPHIEDSILHLQKLTLNLMSKGPALQSKWKFLSKNILWQGRGIFWRVSHWPNPTLLNCFKHDILPGLTDVGHKFYINNRFTKHDQTILHTHTYTHRGYMSLHQPDKFIDIYSPPQICAHFIHVKYILMMEKHTSYLNLSYAELITLTIPPSPSGTTLAALQGHTSLLLQLSCSCVQCMFGWWHERLTC